MKIKDSQEKTRQVIKEAFVTFAKYFPTSDFGKMDQTNHKANIDQTTCDLGRDKKTQNLNLAVLKEILHKGITGEYDESPKFIFPNTPTVKGWIYKYNMQTQKVTTGPKYEETDSPRGDPKKAEVCMWLILTGGRVPTKPKFNKKQKEFALNLISKEGNPKRFEHHKKLLEK